MRKPNKLILISFILLLALLLPLSGVFAKAVYPDVIPLPDGFQPEGIALGYGHQFYTGSIAGGAILRGDLRTGELEQIVDPRPDRMALGMSFDRRSGLLFVSGGGTGAAFVYDGSSGADVASYQLTTSSTTFINDAIVTRQAVYFTDSFQNQFYRLPLGPNGELPDPSQVTTIPFSGDFPFVPGGFNANGIVSSQDGTWLVVVNSAAGQLYRVDPTSGEATQIDLGGADAANGDGLVLRGHSLYVVQNFSQQISVFSINQGLSAASLEQVLTSPNLQIPSTALLFGSSLYAVNPRFDVVPPGGAMPGDMFQIARVPIN